MDQPDFFILGAPKCGTTALAQWLGEHPGIYMSPVKEPHFYSADLNNRQARTAKEYQRLFKGVTNAHQAVGEASVWYLYSHEAVANILSDIPDARFIVCLRNPVDMAWSLHNQHLVASNEDIQDFETAWKAQAARSAGQRVPGLCVDPRLLLYGPACSLGEQMQRLLNVCDRSRVHIVLLDEIKADARSSYQHVLDFLDVADDGRMGFPVVNAAGQRRSPALARAVKRAGQLKSRLGIPRLGTGIMGMHNRINRKRSKKEPMPQHVRAMLQNYFRKDIQILQDLLGRDLGHWVQD